MSQDFKELFDWKEYLVFGAVLSASAGIGIYYGFFGAKQKTTNEFLMAGRSMTVFPMAMSLIASFMSAITLLGTPAEIYQYGTQYLVLGLAYVFVMASTCYFYLPVFFNLQVTSAYQYLELRFSKPVRKLGSLIFMTQMSIYMALVVYAPSLALSQVTGLDKYISVVAMFIVAIFYTSLGGMKAVMWTDTLQVVIMYSAMLMVAIKGAIDTDGFGKIWEISDEGGRLEIFNFNMDPTDRHTVWSLLIGGYFTWMSIYGVNQSQVQRYLTVPTMSQAIRAIWWNGLGLLFLMLLSSIIGLEIYAMYHDCDPLLSEQVSTADQILPLFVMEILGNVTSLPGLFVAGIFSGALSTVSSGLNSLAAITLEDFVKAYYPDISESRATLVSKIISVAFGVVSFGIVFPAAQVEGLLTAALSIFGMVGGPLLGVFTLGMFFPWANAKGAFTGALTSLIVLLWLGLGANIQVINKNLLIPKLPFSTKGCSWINETISTTTEEPHEYKWGGIMEFYRISYMWYSMIGVIITITLGMTVSALTSKSLKDNVRGLDIELLSPLYLRIMSKLPNSVKEFIGWNLLKKNKKMADEGIDNFTFDEKEKSSDFQTISL